MPAQEDFEKRPARVVRLNKLHEFLGIQRSQIAKLVEQGLLHPFSLGPGGRSKVVLETEIAEYQAAAIAKAQAKRRKAS
jgi:predicted DNA-binding transcriptional regulator AlpA